MVGPLALTKMSIFFLVFLIFMNTPLVFTLDTELTVNIEPGTEECFYEKVSRGEVIDIDYQVIGGGQGKLDIIFKLSSPSGGLLVHDIKEPDNVHSVIAEEDGVYKLCWDNTFSHFNAKTVFFELMIGNENGDEDQWKTDMKSNEGLLPNEVYDVKIGDIQGCVERVHDSLHKVRQLQEIKRASEARDRTIAEKNLTYVNMWALAQITLMLVVGIVQVILVRSLFETKPGSKKRFF